MKPFRNVAGKLLISMLLALHMLTVPAYAQSNPTVASIDRLVTQLSQNPESAGIRAGVAVYNTTTGEWIHRHDAEKAYVPSSNLKLLVTAAALDRLGPNYRFTTEIHTTGHITPKGVLQGDLILKGYGDPSLTEESMRTISAELKAKGISSIHGRLLVDESYFDNVRLGEGWMWDDEPYGYSAQISALAVHKNTSTIRLNPDKSVGQASSLMMKPNSKYVTVQNRVTIVEGTNRNVQIDRLRGTNTVILTGTIGKDAEPYERNVTIEDPALFAGDVFKQALAADGILVSSGNLEKTTLSASSPLVSHHSEPLREIIAKLNKESDNFYAEMLTKTLGAVTKSKGSFTSGADAIADFMLKAGIADKYRQVDGSGLSRLDLISPQQIVELLAYVQTREYREDFEYSLPIAGVDGTLKNRMKGTSAENKVRAKTGSMDGVHNLSGYTLTANGDKLAFSILLNGVRSTIPASAFQDEVAVLLSSSLSQETGENPATDSPFSTLAALLNPILEQESMRGVAIGMIVGSLDHKNKEQVLYAKNADALLTPASNMKLLTSAVALRELGPDYTFKTELYVSSLPDKQGVINGDVIIKGYGDPTLQTDDPSGIKDGTELLRFVQALREKGVTRIDGRIIVDESQYDAKHLGTGWAWNDESYGYNAQISALAVNRGAVRLDYQPGVREGSPVAVALHPKTAYVQIRNEATTTPAGTENTLKIERDRGKNSIRLTGNLPLGEEPDYKRIAVEDPAIYTGLVLKEAMEKSGIKVSQQSEVQKGVIPSKSYKISELQSPPLRDILIYGNKNSDNFYMEMLLKRIGADKKGSGSAKAGIEVVRENLQQNGTNSAFDMVDGSGLSLYNQISVRQVSSVLTSMANHSSFEHFYHSLPIAGVDGTLKSRMKQTDAENNVYATTGTLQGVSTLSGYVTTKNNERLYFSIIMNGYTDASKNFTDVQDKLASALANVSLTHH
ncbi:D-alanyl-D-alanine carboxypeptidase/D-alanyl-D-alanine-endopeptidase [Brevibacterium sp. JNUCC-42]|nr:D-alanyl-D-alanine carboxypeptidase/D-alanyl-D-alanine-endopeptidase [Brevibacterium sp. JNUCC-42]